MLYCWQISLFQFLEDVLPFIQEASSVLTNWRGSWQTFKTVSITYSNYLIKLHVTNNNKIKIYWLINQQAILCLEILLIKKTKKNTFISALFLRSLEAFVCGLVRGAFPSGDIKLNRTAQKCCVLSLTTIFSIGRNCKINCILFVGFIHDGFKQSEKTSKRIKTGISCKALMLWCNP